MPKFIITWDAGYGSRDGRVIEADSEEKAHEAAYDAWRQSAEDQADYGAEPYSPERAEELEIEEE